eukprot:PITA_08288
MGSLEGLEYSKLHVLLVPFPAQGHINPMLQFARRLSSKNLQVTFVTTKENRKRMLQSQDKTSEAPKKRGDVRFETILDGITSDSERGDVVIVSAMLYKVGGLMLGNLVERFNAEGNQISCIIQDSFLPWVSDVAKKFDIPFVFFWMQSCAVYAIYHHFVYGKLATSLDGTQNEADEVEIPGLPPVSVSDLPSLVQPSSPYESLRQVIVDKFKSLPVATWVLGNSFEELESEEINSMKLIDPV